MQTRIKSKLVKKEKKQIVKQTLKQFLGLGLIDNDLSPKKKNDSVNHTYLLKDALDARLLNGN